MPNPDDLHKQAERKRQEAGSYRHEADVQQGVVDSETQKMDYLRKDVERHQATLAQMQARAERAEHEAAELERHSQEAAEQDRKLQAAQAAAAALNRAQEERAA